MGLGIIMTGGTKASALLIVPSNRYARGTFLEETHDGYENPPRGEEELPAAWPDE
jgi:hypothetical protein